MKFLGRDARTTVVAGMLVVLIAARAASDGVVIVLGSKMVEVGNQSPGAEHTFGSIEDVAIERDGAFYVLDSEFNSLRAYDPRGAFVATAARPGTGPGELAVPRAASVGAAGQLLVLDVANQRVSDFRRRGRTLRFHGSFPVRVPGSDMCVLGQRLYTVGAHEGRLLHEFSIDGRYIGSFGEPYGRGQEVLSRSLSAGVIACAAERRLVLVAAPFLGEVRAYRTDGSTLWERRLADFRPVGIEVKANRVTYSMPVGGYDVVATVSVVSADVAMIQMGFLNSAATRRDDYRTIATRLIALDDGREIGRQNGIGKTAAVRANRIYTVQNGLSPRILVHAYRVGEEP